MKKARLRHISPTSLAKNLGLVFLLFGVIGSILAVIFQLLGAAAVLAGPVLFSEAGSRNAFVWLLNPLFLAAYGYLTGLIGAWIYNLIANRTGGLVYYLDSEQIETDTT